MIECAFSYCYLPLYVCMCNLFLSFHSCNLLLFGIIYVFVLYFLLLLFPYSAFYTVNFFLQLHFFSNFFCAPTTNTNLNSIKPSLPNSLPIFDWPIKLISLWLWLWCNATDNNISVILWWSVLLLEETGENHRPAASHLTNFITSCCIKYTSPWAWFDLTPLVVIGTDCMGNCKSNYHMIMTMTVPQTCLTMCLDCLIRIWSRCTT